MAIFIHATEPLPAGHGTQNIGKSLTKVKRARTVSDVSVRTDEITAEEARLEDEKMVF